MKQYKKNMEDKDEVFEKRRQDVINKTKLHSCIRNIDTEYNPSSSNIVYLVIEFSYNCSSISSIRYAI